MKHEQHDSLPGPDRSRPPEEAEAGTGEWARRKVFAEFSRWAAKLRDSRLAERSDRLWRLLLDGGLTRAGIAAAVGALLYCVTPVDLVPDAIPFLGLADDLLVVMGALAYLEGKR